MRSRKIFICSCMAILFCLMIASCDLSIPISSYSFTETRVVEPVTLIWEPTVISATHTPSLGNESQPVALVGNFMITTDQFQDRVRYERFQTVETYISYATSNYASDLTGQLLVIQSSLDDHIQFGSDTLDMMIEEAALIQKAESLGITVTDEEIEAQFQENFQYYPNVKPSASTPTPIRTYYPTSTLSPLQKSIIDYTTTNSEVMTEIPDIIDSPIEGSTTGLIATTITSTSDLNHYDYLINPRVLVILKNTGISEKELREYIRNNLFERKVKIKVAAGVADEQEMVWARHILVTSQEQANEIEAMLENGEDWSELAATYSTDSSNKNSGGDLGWFTLGTMVKEFEDAVWSLEIGEISDPFTTKYGYHIVQVLGHEQRQLTDEQLRVCEETEYQSFIVKAQNEFGVKKYDVWTSVVPSEPTIPEQFLLSESTMTP